MKLFFFVFVLVVVGFVVLFIVLVCGEDGILVVEFVGFIVIVIFVEVVVCFEGFLVGV